MAMDGDRDDSVSRWSVDNRGGGVRPSPVLSTRSIDDPAKVEAMVSRMREAKESGAIEVLTKINHFMQERKIRIEDIFTRGGFDKSGDGKLDEGEFRVALERLGMGALTNPESRKLFDFFDKDHDDLIEEDELELALHQLREDVKRLQDLKRELKPSGESHSGDDKSKTAARMLDLTSAIKRDRGDIIKGVSSLSSYRSEGDKQMYTTVNLVKRKKLRESQVVTFWLDQYWNTLGPELTGGVAGAVDQRTMPKGVYTLLFTKIAKVLLEPEAFNEGVVRAANAKDWEREFGLETGAINHKQFKNSIFETIDIWTASATEDEYKFFASELFVRITSGDAKERQMREIKEINHWSEDDRDLKKKQRATDESVSSWQSRGESSAHNDIEAIMKEEEARKLAAECMATVKAHIESGDQPRSIRNVWKACTDAPLNERRLNALLGAVAEDARSEYERLMRKKGVPRDKWQQAELDAWIQEKNAQVRELNERRRAECIAMEERARKKIKVLLRQDTAEYLRGQDESDVNKGADGDMPSPHKPAIHGRTDPTVGKKQQNEDAAPSMSPIPGAAPPASPAVASPASPRKRLSQRTTSGLDTATTSSSVVDGETGVGSRKLEYTEASDDQSIMSMDVSLSASAKHRHQRDKFFESPKVEGRKKKADFFPAELVAEWRIKYTEIYRKKTKSLPEDIPDIEVFEKWFVRELDHIRREEIENARRKSKVQTSGVRISSLGAQSKEADPDWVHYRLDVNLPTDPHASVDKSYFQKTAARPSTEPQAQLAQRRLLEPTIRWIRTAHELPGHALAPPLSPRTPEDLKFGPNARPRVATPLDDLAKALHMDQVQRGSICRIALPNTTGYGQEMWNVRPSTTELKTFGYSTVAQPIVAPKEPSPHRSTRQREASDRRAANDWLEMRTYSSSAGYGTDVLKEQQVVVSVAGDDNKEAGGSSLLDNWTALEQGTESRRSKQDQGPSLDSSSQVKAELASTFHMSMVSSIISESERSGESEDSDEDPLDFLDAVDIYGLMDSVEHLKMANRGPRNMNNLDEVKVQARFIAQATMVDTAAAIKQAAIAPFSKAERHRRGHRYNDKGEADIIDPVATAARSLSVKSRVLMKRGRSLLRKERALFNPRRLPTSPPAKAQKAIAVATTRGVRRRTGDIDSLAGSLAVSLQI